MIGALRHATACSVCMTVLSLAPAQTEDHFKILDGKQIKARVVGLDITDGPHWSMYVRSDGVLIGEESGSTWTGSWTIRNDRLCMTMPSSTSADCNEVSMSGRFIRMRASKDQDMISATVTTHSKKR